MRPRDANPGRTAAGAVGRLLGVTVLVAVLTLGGVPVLVSPVGAAPPDSVPAAGIAAGEAVNAADDGDRLNTGAGPWSVSRPGREGRSGGDGSPDAQRDAGSGSVRARGREAPVTLRQTELERAAEPKQREKQSAEKAPESADPGDGPVPRRDKPQTNKKDRERPRRSVRVWPMPADSYTFTQDFGCTQQLGNLYFPGEGCPASAPVIHTGIDLAAPEGTLFYAAASGWVTFSDFDRPTPDANTRIIIQHDGRNEDFASDYLHWIASYVEEGDYVRAGQPIGEVGSVGYSTGPHLHYSVTDLRTGEHIDPVRWLPDEAGREAYTGRRPSAQMRLPAGTTAGQPESADPAPPPPPEREKVPDSRPEKDKGARKGAERKRDRSPEERRETRGKDETATRRNETGGKRARNTDESAAAEPDETTPEAKNRDRARTRERNKDGTSAEDSSTGDEDSDRRPGGTKKSADEKRNGGEQNKADKDDRDKTDSGKKKNGNKSDSAGNGDRGDADKEKHGSRNKGGKDGSGGSGESGGGDRRDETSGDASAPNPGTSADTEDGDPGISEEGGSTARTPDDSVDSAERGDRQGRRDRVGNSYDGGDVGEAGDPDVIPTAVGDEVGDPESAPTPRKRTTRERS